MIHASPFGRKQVQSYALCPRRHRKINPTIKANNQHRVEFEFDAEFLNYPAMEI
jgi:hypothetical protein